MCVSFLFAYNWCISWLCGIVGADGFWWFFFLMCVWFSFLVGAGGCLFCFRRRLAWENGIDVGQMCSVKVGAGRCLFCFGLRFTWENGIDVGQMYSVNTCPPTFSPSASSAASARSISTKYRTASRSTSWMNTTSQTTCKYRNSVNQLIACYIGMFGFEKHVMHEHNFADYM